MNGSDFRRTAHAPDDASRISNQCTVPSNKKSDYISARHRDGCEECTSGVARSMCACQTHSVFFYQIYFLNFL